MMEESYLASITDPAHGSFYIEELTKEIAERAWNRFQQIESEGGFLNSLKNGNIKDQIEGSHRLRLKRFQSGESTLVGVSKYVSEQSDTSAFTLNNWNGISSRNLSEELGKEGEKPDFTKIAFDPQHSDIQQCSEWETQEGIQLNSSYSEENAKNLGHLQSAGLPLLRGPMPPCMPYARGRFASMQVLAQLKNQMLLQKKSGSRSERIVRCI